MPAPFQNRYKKTYVKTDKDCWTCRKTTTTCLLTDNYASGGDFLYTCEAHLKDRNFATPIETEVSSKKASTSVSQSEIDSAIKEYEQRKKAKSDKEGTAEEADTKDSDDKMTESKEGPKAKTAKPPPPAPVILTEPEPTHYQLHKSFFEMRLRLHQQRSHLKEAQSRRSQLVFPSAPSDKPGTGSAGPAGK